MIYKNVELHNVAELIENSSVELRFVMKSDTVKIKLKKKDGKR